MFKKNEATSAERVVYFQLVNKNDGSAVTTGTVTARVLKNGTPSVPSNSPAHSYGGVWTLLLTQAEMNTDSLAVVATHNDAIPAATFIKTSEKMVDELNDFDHSAEFVTFASPVDANVTEVKGVAVTDVTDFHASTAGLSTFNANSDVVKIGFVQGITVASPDDFKATTVAISLGDSFDANIVSVQGVTVAGVTDFHVSTSGLSTFDHTTDKVDLVDNAVDADVLATSAVNEIVTGLFGTTVDGSIDYEQVIEMLLAFMAGKVNVTDNGDTRYFEFFKRDGTTTMYGITASELAGQEGQRASTGSVT